MKMRLEKVNESGNRRRLFCTEKNPRKQDGVSEEMAFDALVR
jgi:hypothetical protein